MALFSIWLGSRQRRSLVLPSGRTFSRTVMLLHQLVGSPLFYFSACHRVIQLCFLKFGNRHSVDPCVTWGNNRAKGQIDWLTVSRPSVHLSGGGLVASLP